MAKKNKPSAAAAAARAAETQQAPEVETQKKQPETLPAEQKTILLPQSKIDKLSQDSKVAYANLLQERYVRNNEGQTDVMRRGFNMMIDVIAVDIAITELVNRGNPTAFIVQNDPGRYGALQAIATEMGVRLPDFNALPAPTPQQLEQAGLSGDAGQAKLLTVVKANVEKKAIDQKKAEQKKVELDPTKIKNEAELKEALTSCFGNGNDGPVARINKAINFYNSYMLIQAGEDEAKKNAVTSMPRIDMMKKITEIVGDVPFAVNGFGSVVAKFANENKTPVVPFCIMRKAFGGPTAKNEVDDQYIADVTKTLVLWKCNADLATYNKLVERNRARIEALEKEEGKANEIAVEKTSLRANESQVSGINSIIQLVTNPSFDIINNLETNYNADPASAAYKSAHCIVSLILKTFYPKNLKIEDYTEESILAAVKKRAGIITNMFADPLSKSIEYKDAIIPELQKVEKKD